MEKVSIKIVNKEGLFPSTVSILAPPDDSGGILDSRYDAYTIIGLGSSEDYVLCIRHEHYADIPDTRGYLMHVVECALTFYKGTEGDNTAVALDYTHAVKTYYYPGIDVLGVENGVPYFILKDVPGVMYMVIKA